MPREAAGSIASFLPASVSSASTAAPPPGSGTAEPAGASSARLWFLLILVGIGILAVPLALRPLNRAVLGDLPSLGYLPSLEIRRPHGPFRAQAITDLVDGKPAWVFIGDSMLGTRVDPALLGRISTTGREYAAFLYHAATGPGWWYLAFKNQLVASGEKPRMTFFFFRDTNLTDTMFRLESHYGNALDEVATEYEPELDRLVANHRKGRHYRVHRVLDQVYEANVATSWLEPAVRRWWVRLRDPHPDVVEAFEWNLEQVFGVGNLRYDVPADLAASDVAGEPDFHRDLPTSVLPLIMELSREHGLPVCFVRVQRRPRPDGPPDQSPALVKYVADFRAWAEANGARFHDDTGDPEMTLDLYEDGDHVADRRRYTEIFRKRLDPLFRLPDRAGDAPGAVEGR